MEQKPYVTCSVGSCKQFRLQRLSEQRQRWRRMGCSGKLFQTVVAAAEKALTPMVARLVREMKTKSAVADECGVWTSETR